MYCLWAIGADVNVGGSGSVGDNGAHPYSLVMHQVSLLLLLRVLLMLDVICGGGGGAYMRIGEGMIQAIWGFWGHRVCQKHLKRNI